MREQPKTQQWMILATVGLGTFMSALDSSVVNAILPVISSAMRSPIDAAQWIISLLHHVSAAVLPDQRPGLEFGADRAAPDGTTAGHGGCHADSGAISDRTGARIPGTVGMLILGIGLFLLSRLDATTPFASIALALGVAGLGTGIFIAPNNSSLMGSAPLDRQGIASGILATARNVGMVLGIGLAGAILTTFLGPSGASDSVALYHAVSIGFMTAAGIACLAAWVSLVRGNH